MLINVSQPEECRIAIIEDSVLEALGVAHLESDGCCLTRTRVELAVDPHNSNEERRNKSHEEGNADQCVATRGVPDCDR